MRPTQLDVQQAIAQATALQRAGQYARAETLCRTILQSFPADATALRLLGVCLLAQGASSAAERALAASLSVQPDQPVTLANHGIALYVLRSFDLALERLDKALRQDPRNGTVHWYRARTLASLGRDDDALIAYDQAARLHRFETATAPSHDRDTAHASDRIPATTEAQTELLTEWLHVAERVLKQSPEHRPALAVRAFALAQLERWVDAVEAYRTLVARHPDEPEFRARLAWAYVRLDRPDDALAACATVLLQNPASAAALNSRAAALEQLGRYEEAERDLNALVDVEPNNAQAHWHRAINRLVRGQLAEAWPDYEWRLQLPRGLKSLNALPIPAWSGKEPLAGKTIMLHPEQGLGDTIQFARYARVLAAHGARVVVGCHRSLKPLIQTADDVHAVVTTGDAMPTVDLHCPLMSLPALLATTVANIPCQVPYLHTDPGRLAKWSQRLGPSKRFRVGIAWAGSPTHAEDQRRSIATDQLAPLFEANVEFFCLSKFIRAQDEEFMRKHDIRHFGDELADFAETAALTRQMDLVISVDTVIAHLAGAMAMPVWVLIATPPEWRWMLQRDDSPWYPSARLFRQRSRGDWSEVIERVARELGSLSASARA